MEPSERAKKIRALRAIATEKARLSGVEVYVRRLTPFNPDAGDGNGAAVVREYISPRGDVVQKSTVEY